ncbi:MAG: hypothetical protein HYR62_01885 [Actinobacteria bacterium]|nr:hypothetical protein [Actinomycetota bacterium]MBI3687233.1 hypothetical protein [Actinomycetota bacterium]
MLRITLGEKVLDFDDNRLLNTEAIALRKVSGLTVDEFLHGISEFDPVALTVLVWLARRRAGESDLRFSDVEFDMGVTFDLDQLDDDGTVISHPAGADESTEPEEGADPTIPAGPEPAT